ncbi:glycosyltransferase family 2 protein [Albibacterium indicum]|uniref:glycosyltransferase family 2 protein n=1 Tax=Albibacterium indicum TaxID=2292082 RepID=UPI000E4EA119|nr:glycosyltransferase family 2 protein [Pedobacter indicus]
MKVSIIIPVFQVADFIERSLTSALNQSYGNIEVILVDDCGTDNSMALARSVLDKHPRGSSASIVVHEKNRGLSAARNTGVVHATGDYVYFLDSDDEITNNCIELMMEPIGESDLDFVIADYEVAGSDIPYPPLRLARGPLRSDERILLSYLNEDWYMMAWNKLVNRDFLLANNLTFKEGLIHEDNLWSFQLACLAESAFVISDSTYIYHIQDESITQKPSLKNFKSYLRIIDNMQEFVDKDNKLKSHLEVYQFIERLKSYFFFRIATADIDERFKIAAYKHLRKDSYKNALLYLSKHKFLKSKVRIKFHSRLIMHYLMPVDRGYQNYKKLVVDVHGG